ncbi:unnamed protein product [Vitrella brassicaformis CCMP3155]|uniref:Uncharacterized protein n=1 Tax=Vitrella brassicaformis (strain CCMP3155) TaxID=1169540 RepID=A0A0G4F264_VITBC|nr:unnamed protein product [Vitrella brassicaformis CCMP3155]|eukprot:CEM05440.1 unnamed protein product [Vitrella brassicaformis CCMP3155]
MSLARELRPQFPFTPAPSPPAGCEDLWYRRWAFAENIHPLAGTPSCLQAALHRPTGWSTWASLSLLSVWSLRSCCALCMRPPRASHRSWRDGDDPNCKVLRVEAFTLVVPHPAETSGTDLPYTWVDTALGKDE